MDEIRVFLSSLRWQDLLDIAINSYILFRLYVLFHGTNTFRVMLGIAGLWFFQQIAIYLGLIVTSWLIQGITAAAAIIIIVIFRNEIRSVFQTQNLRSIFWGVPRQTRETPVDILSDALFELSFLKVGALVVFPGRENLTELIQGGIAWHGKISKEMIRTIFWRNNPVHDGAIIIQGDRVELVGCILPLSHRRDLPAHFGTRHRAMAGLAEVSDAVVVAVSEESGSVTAAKGDGIHPVKRRRDLEQILEGRTGRKDQGRTLLKRESFRRRLAAVLSILFITGIWASFTRSMDTLISLDIPIRYSNRRPGLEIVETTANIIQLQLSGSGALIRTLKADQVQVNLDLGKAIIGKNTFLLTSDNISLPPGIKLSRIEPPKVEVVVDVPIIKEVAVQVDWVGKLPEELIITEVILSPASVRISGLSLLLNQCETVYTEKVLLDNISMNGERTAKLAPESPLQLAAGQSGSVRVRFVVQQRAPAESPRAE
ncbi:MAG: diadenylate cyclase [Thermodesulfobacteriota bacterium]